MNVKHQTITNDLYDHHLLGAFSFHKQSGYSWEIGRLADNATKKFEILNDQKSFMSKLCESGGCSKILLISLNVGVVAISEL